MVKVSSIKCIKLFTIINEETNTNTVLKNYH